MTTYNTVGADESVAKAPRKREVLERIALALEAMARPGIEEMRPDEIERRLGGVGSDAAWTRRIRSVVLAEVEDAIAAAAARSGGGRGMVLYRSGLRAAGEIVAGMRAE